jgi:predicted MPP superfamily phosphohydrolase
LRLPIEVGLAGPLHIRQERIRAEDTACRLMYVSDIHLRHGRSPRIAEQVLAAAAEARPDIVLLGGDVIDQRPELQALTELVSALVGQAPVVAVSGNHDRAVGERAVRDAIVEGGGTWIERQVFELQHCGRRIVISGPRAPFPRRGDYHVLCAHNPRIWKRARSAGYDLVLAGHLHGCQFVAFHFRDR